MTRYINAEKITFTLMDMAEASRKLYPGIMTSISQINAMPAADVQKIRHGEWKGYTKSAFHGVDEFGSSIYRDVTIWYCSECNRRSVVKEKFCPNCGAKMDGKDGEK